MRPKPQQPEDHESKCPCLDCEAWAWDLIDWEQEEKFEGRDPWRDDNE